MTTKLINLWAVIDATGRVANSQIKGVADARRIAGLVVPGPATLRQWTEEKIPTADVRRGDLIKVNAGHGWWPIVKVHAVAHTSTRAEFTWLLEVGPRTARKYVTRDLASQTTVYRLPNPGE